jgi:hypothetical protein
VEPLYLLSFLFLLLILLFRKSFERLARRAEQRVRGRPEMGCSPEAPRAQRDRAYGAIRERSSLPRRVIDGPLCAPLRPEPAEPRPRAEPLPAPKFLRAPRRLLGGRGELRRAVLLVELLGQCRGLDPPRAARFQTGTGAG